MGAAAEHPPGMSQDRFVVGEVGARPGPGTDLEDAIAKARASARTRGEKRPVHRLHDGAHIADVWPDGVVDLTAEGAKIA